MLIQKLIENEFLFSELVKRDFKRKYKRTVLGMLWSLLSPLLMLFVYRIVFTRFFGSNMAHYTTYLFSGHLVFSCFQEATNAGMTSLVYNSDIYSKVNVPKYIFLLAQNVTVLINFAMTLCVYFLFAAIDHITFHWNFLLLVFPIACLITFNIGVGLILSAMFVMFRDIQYLYGVLTQIILYCSAIFYSIDQYSQTAQFVFLLNPVYVYIRYFRKIVIENTIPTVQFHVLAAGYALIFIAIGGHIYKKNNHKFLYYI